MKFFHYFCLISFFSLGLLAQEVKTVVVESEGTGKEEAITLALCMAVEQVGGVRIQFVGTTQDFVLVKKVLFTEARGFIQKFDILENRPLSGGLYWVKVCATVDSTKIVGRIDEIVGLLKMKGYPKIIVDLSESIEHQENEQRIAEFNLQSAFKSKESRMNVLSYRDIEGITQREIKIAQEKGEISGVHQLMRKLGFDILIQGNVHIYLVETKKNKDEMVYVYSGSLQAEAIRMDNATITASVAMLRNFEGPIQSDVANNLLRLMGAEVAEKIIGQIIHEWIDDINRVVPATFYCTGIQLTDLESLEQAFSTIKAIQGFQQKGFDTDQVEYQLQIKGINLTEIAKQLNNTHLKAGKVLKIKSVKENVMRTSTISELVKIQKNEEIEPEIQWNIQDVHITARVVGDSLKNHRLASSNPPVAIQISRLLNKTNDHHINTKDLTSHIQQALLETGSYRILSDIEDLLEDGETKKSSESEVLADYLLRGQISEDTTISKGKTKRCYTVSLELVNTKTNELVWKSINNICR